MTDTAVLAIAVDSSQTVTAASNLERMASAANSSGLAVAKLTTLESALARAVADINIGLVIAKNGTGTLASAHAGLSTQAMAAGHSIRSMVESMAMGMPVTQVLGQQLGHLSYAASGEGGLAGAFKSAGGAILGLLSPTTLVVGGLAAVAAASAFALSSIAKTEIAFDDTSRAIGVTIGQLHGLESAAAFKGIDTTEFLKAMEKFGASVYDAKNNMGGLAETFRANGTSAQTFTDYLEKAADLIKRANTDQQRLQLLQQMGLPATMAWVDLLSSGGKGLRDAAAEATKFGEVADYALIAKARKFDEEWAKTFKNLKDGFKSTFIDAGSWLDTFNSKLNTGLMGLGVNVGKNLLRDSLTGGSTSGSRLGSGSNVDDFYKGLGTAAPGNAAPPSVDKDALKNQIARQQQLIGLFGSTATAEDAARAVDLQMQAARISGLSIDKSRVDTLKRLAIEQANGVAAIKASTDATRTEAETIGMSVGAAAAYTVEQNALNAAKQRGTTLSEASRASIHAEASALGQAAAQADLMRSAFTGLVQGPMQAFRSALSQGSSFFDSLKKAGISALDAISTKLVDMAANNLWKAAFPTGSGGSFLSLFGGSNATDGIGGFGPAAPVGINHGGYGPGDSMPVRFVPSRVLLNAPRFHSGIGPGERAAIIRTDESVLTPGQMKAMGGGGISVRGDTHITIQGNADEKTVALLRQELAKRDAEFASNVVQTVKRAKQGRHL